MSDTFGKNHATILRILKTKGSLHGEELKNEITNLNKLKRGLGMSMTSKAKAMRELIEWKMMAFRKEGRGRGRVYSITECGEKALSGWEEGKIVLSKKFLYDLGFQNFGEADVIMHLPFRTYPTHDPFFEDAVAEPMEELCTQILESWHEYFPNEPVDGILEVKLKSEPIDVDILHFREELSEIQDRVERLCEKWYEESGLFGIFDQYGLFKYAFEVVMCEEELKERGIQLTIKNYLELKKPILVMKKKGEPLIDFCFSINGKVIDLKENLLEKHWTILNDMKQPKIKRWIRKYRRNLDDWFPYIPWDELGFPSKLVSRPSALSKNLFIPKKEQIYDANVRMYLHFLARLPIDEAIDSWNFYFQNAPLPEFDDHIFLVTYNFVKQELKYAKIPEDIRIQVVKFGTTRTFETPRTTLVLPGREMTLEKMWWSKGKLSSIESDLIKSIEQANELDRRLNQEMPSKAEERKIFQLFDVIYQKWERNGKPIRHTHKVFRFLKEFLKKYKDLVEKHNFDPKRASDGAADLMKDEVKGITF